MQRLIPTLRQDGVPLDLIMLIRTVLAATKEISFRVSQGALSGVLGSTLDENIQGETQKKLDVLSNQLLKDMLLSSPDVRSIASEEEDNVVKGTENAPYIVAFDPLDGSSNIDINGQIGTIFTIYKARDDVASDSPEQFAQKGRDQVCAGYVLYGPSTMLVMTTGKATRGYTLDRTHGSYLLTQDVFEIPAETSEFSINMANQEHWEAPVRNYIYELQKGLKGERGKFYNMRWNGAMVGDAHRIISRGGIFLYPSDNKNPKQPNKLRLLYEANPIAMLIENAGGLATMGTEAILDVFPSELHQRVSVVLGSKNEVAHYVNQIVMAKNN